MPGNCLRYEGGPYVAECNPALDYFELRRDWPMWDGPMGTTGPARSATISSAGGCRRSRSSHPTPARAWGVRL
jgi:hypothetical protein